MNNIYEEMSEFIKETLQIYDDEDSYKTWSFIVENIELLRKIPVYNREIKYILKKYTDDAFQFSSPEILKYYFIPIICKCVILEKYNINPIEWIEYINEK